MSPDAPRDASLKGSERKKKHIDAVKFHSLPLTSVSQVQVGRVSSKVKPLHLLNFISPPLSFPVSQGSALDNGSDESRRSSFSANAEIRFLLFFFYFHKTQLTHTRQPPLPPFLLPTHSPAEYPRVLLEAQYGNIQKSSLCPSQPASS